MAENTNTNVVQPIVIHATGARYWKFDDENGQTIEGVTVYHTVSGDPQNGEYGVITQKVTLPKETLKDVAVFPYPCRLTVVTEQRLGGKGVYTKVTGLALVK